MKSSSLYLTLHLAPLAWGVPMTLPQVLEIDPRSYTPPGRTPGTRWRGLPRIPPDVIAFGGGVDSTIFDNRPVRPMSSDQSSRVLVVEKPLATENLLSLGPDKAAGSNGVRKQHRGSGSPTQRRLDMEDEDALEISDMDISIAIPTSSRLRTRCRYARLSREQNDVLVVVLAVAFLLGVLLMESWGSVYRSASRVLNLPGAIRLETGEEGVRQPLSIQALVMEGEKAGGQAEVQTATPS